MSDIVYTSGVWDLFHIGHLNIIKRAHDYGDFLIVGVTTDEATAQYKNPPTIPFEQRFAIVEALRLVDMAVPLYELGSIALMKRYNVTVRVTGDDFGQYSMQETSERGMAELGIKLVILPRTPGVSTTLIKRRIRED